MKSVLLYDMSCVWRARAVNEKPRDRRDTENKLAAYTTRAQQPTSLGCGDTNTEWVYIYT